MKKIDINEEVDRRKASDILDNFRLSTRSNELDPLKVSALLLKLVNRVNELQDIVLKMRDRKKPGPKVRGGGLT